VLRRKLFVDDLPQSPEIISGQAPLLHQLRHEGFGRTVEHPVECARQRARSRFFFLDHGAEPMSATFFLMVDVPFVLEDAQESEHSIVGEVDIPIRQSIANFGGCRGPEVPEDRHYVELALGEGYTHFDHPQTKELVEG
jgi:hypothetical protein